MLTITRLDIDDAYLLIKGAREKANEIGVPMCIAVTDESGNLIAFERMNGGKAHSITVAQDKAFTAGSGRKAGVSKLTEARKKLLESSDDIITALVDQAKAGDVQAIKLCIERILPVIKEIPPQAMVNNPDATKTELFQELQHQVLNGEITINDANERVKFIKKIKSDIKFCMFD